MIRHLLQAGARHLARRILRQELETSARLDRAIGQASRRGLVWERDEARAGAELAQQRADSWQRDCEEARREIAEWVRLGTEAGDRYAAALLRADQAEAKGRALEKQLAHYKRGMANWMQRALVTGRIPDNPPTGPVTGHPCAGCFGCVRRYISQPNICVGAGWIAPRADFEDGGEPLLRVDDLPVGGEG